MRHHFQHGLFIELRPMYRAAAGMRHSAGGRGSFDEACTGAAASDPAVIAIAIAAALIFITISCSLGLEHRANVLLLVTASTLLVLQLVGM